MLSENIKAIRKSKGLSQQELAVKLNVVRQTNLKMGTRIVRPGFRSVDFSVGSPGDTGEHFAWRNCFGIGG